MAPVQTRRSRKLREATYIDGQQNSVMKEISTPNRDGTIPLLNFLENTTKFMRHFTLIQEGLKDDVKDDVHKLFHCQHAKKILCVPSFLPPFRILMEKEMKVVNH